MGIKCDLPNIDSENESIISIRLLAIFAFGTSVNIDVNNDCGLSREDDERADEIKRVFITSVPRRSHQQDTQIYRYQSYCGVATAALKEMHSI